MWEARPPSTASSTDDTEVSNVVWTRFALEDENFYSVARDASQVQAIVMEESQGEFRTYKSKQ